MKNINQRCAKCLGVLALLAVAFGLSGCKSEDRSMAQQWGDRQVAKSVKKELSRDRLYHYPDVVPMVHDGIVQLTGFVDTMEQRQRAAELAAQARGVVEIINAIQLKPGRPGIVNSTNTPVPVPAAMVQPAAAETPATPQQPQPTP